MQRRIYHTIRGEEYLELPLARGAKSFIILSGHGLVGQTRLKSRSTDSWKAIKMGGCIVMWVVVFQSFDLSILAIQVRT